MFLAIGNGGLIENVLIFGVFCYNKQEIKHELKHDYHSVGEKYFTMNSNNSQFKIIDHKIYDPNGQEFIIKGGNMFTWEGIENVDNYLNTWGFNTIRVPNYLLGSYDQPHPADDDYRTNHKIVDAYTSQGATVIFDAHDLIGSYYEDEEWEILKEYWRDMAQEFKDNPYVWFNLHNEPGNDTPNKEKWVSYHRELIDIIRAEGANNMIVVDGEAWGQDYHTQTIASHASEVMAGNENIVFSVHVYDQWNSNDIGAYFDLLQSQNIPVIVGEYGSETNDRSTLPATEQMLQAVQEREIGRIVWNLKADDLNDLTTGWKGHAKHFDGTNTNILTELGELVWNDLQRTEDLEQLNGYQNSHNIYTFSDGVFEVDSSGQIQFDFLFDGHWFEGELAVFNLEGMETYTPGSLEFIQEAATRALTNSEQGHILLQDSTEKARFDSPLPWEASFNDGEYLGQKTFNMTEGSRFAFMLIQNTTVQEIASNPENIWQDRKLPLFSIPEANPGTAEGQMVAVDGRGIFAYEDLRVDWNKSDRDYNDIVFQLQGANGVVSSMDEWVNPDRDWRSTAIGQELLASNGNDETVSGEDDQNEDEEGENSLFGGSGDDFLNGEKGEDLLYGGLGNDTLFGGKGEDSLFGDSGDDFLDGEKGEDLLYGGLGNDTLFGGKGEDSLFGDSGDDFLDGEKGEDLLSGGLGNDTLFGGRGGDSLLGGLGNDTLFGGRGGDSLFGDSGDDFLNGEKGEDLLYGGLGNDTLFGGEGEDVLYGSLGNDTLFGGKGEDVFILRNDGSVDTILDFEDGEDIIELSTGLQFADLTITQGSESNSNDVLISLTENNQLLTIIRDQTPDDLTIADFI
ncbi:MAG: cellulase family glycosylhydrolase [Xenococcaceae cyanobacterium MO_167.B27]|nr:cellulase family glycosylhydrolase [Xenococcaceae cyanobacterium MO_167.B27]